MRNEHIPAQRKDIKTRRVMKIRDKAEIFHSSGYAQAQSGTNFGAASGENFSMRKEIDKNRKFVRKYNNSRIMNRAYAFERVRSYIPRTGQSSEGKNRSSLFRKNVL